MTETITPPDTTDPEAETPEDPTPQLTKPKDSEEDSDSQGLPKPDVSYSVKDPLLLAALKTQESGNRHDSHIRGPMTYTGEKAMGVGQIMPATWKQYAKPGEDPDNEADNNAVRNRILDNYSLQFNGDISLTLAAYNAGPGVIKKWAARTENGSWPEVKDKMLAAGAYKETTDYVTSILKDYESKKKGTDSYARAQANGTHSYGNPDTLAAAPAPSDSTSGSSSRTVGNMDEFKANIRKIAQDPSFETQPATSQIKSLNGLLKSKQWVPQAYDLARSLATDAWKGASPEDTPNFSDLTGPVPIVPAGQDPAKVLSDWKNQAYQKVVAAGLKPAVLGDQFVKYLADGVQSETEAFQHRNQGLFASAGSEIKGATESMARGAIGVIAGAEAGVTRLAGSLIDPKRAGEIADRMEEFPEEVFGSATDNGFYKRGTDNRILKNPDGTPQAHWQAQAWEGLGGMLAFGGGTNIARAAGVSGGLALWGANTSVAALQMTDSAFKHVYQDTGDLGKAYATMAFTLPAAATFGIGEVGIVSGALRPSLKSLSAADRGAFFGSYFTRRAAEGAVTGGTSNLITQEGENVLSGKPINKEEVGMSAGQAALGMAVPGLFYDYFHEPAAFKAREQTRRAQVEATAVRINEFRYSLDNEREIPGNKADVPESLLNQAGVTITGETKTGFTVQKTTDVSASETRPEHLQTVLDNIQSNPTPSEMLSRVAPRLAFLTNKDARTPEENTEVADLQQHLLKAPDKNHLYESNQVHENGLRNILAQSPGILPVEYSQELGKWRHVETGETAQYAKDILFPDEGRRLPVEDVSDISNIEINDHDTLMSGQHPEAAVKDTQDSLDNLETQRQQTSDELKSTEQQIKSSVKENQKTDKNNNLQTDINNRKKQISDLEEQTKTAPQKPATPATDKITETKAALTKQQSVTLKLQNNLGSAKTIAAKKAIRDRIETSRQAERTHKATIKDLDPAFQQEKAAQATHAEKLSQHEKLLATKKSLIARQKTAIAKHPSPSEDGSLKDKIDVTPLHAKVADLQTKLADHAATKTSLQETLNTKLAEARIFNQKLSSIEKTAKSGASAAHDNGVISITGGMSRPVKAQVIAHELGHVVQDRLALPEEVKTAIEATRQAHEDSASVTSAEELAGKTLLPAIKDQIPLAENTKASDLTPKAKNAVFGAREFEANQLAAVILKHNGYDTGDYRIVPELEKYMESVRLPQMPEDIINAKGDAGSGRGENITGQSGRRAADAGTGTGETTQNNTGSSGQRGSAASGGESGAPAGESIQSPPPKPPGSEGSLPSSKTGKLKETAFSRSVGEKVPGHTPVMQEQNSRDLAHLNADKYIAEKGYTYVRDKLRDLNSNISLSEDRGAYADALLRHAQAQVERPGGRTPENYIRLNEAEQIRAITGSHEGTALALIARFRGKAVNSFGEFFSATIRTMREAGIPQSKLDLMVNSLEFQKKLSETYEKFKTAPEGKIKDQYGTEALAKGMAHIQTDWPTFLKGYYKTNMLSGPSTLVRVFTGHGTMGPLFTLFSHPVYGNLLNLKTIFQALPLIGKESGRIWRGESDAFAGGLADPDALSLPGGNAPAALARYYNRYGNYVGKSLAVISNAMSTLSERMAMTHEKYQEFQAKYKDDPDGMAKAAGELLISPERKEAAITQARSELNQIKTLSEGSDTFKADSRMREGEVMVRAFEIMDNDRFNDADRQYAKDYGDSVSLRGDYGNWTSRAVDRIFKGPMWAGDSTGAVMARHVRDVVVPFINVLNHLTDFGMDFIPGSFIAMHGKNIAEYAFAEKGMKPDNWSGRSEALHNRLVSGQILGTILTGTLLTALRSGLIEITGEPEKVLSRSGDPKQLGKTARASQDFREFAQKGSPPNSIIFHGLGGYALKYDDIPGLNFLTAGVYRANKSINAGGSIGSAIGEFYGTAMLSAVPLLGNGSLNAPYKKLLNDFLAPADENQVPGANIGTALKNFARNSTQALVPYSGMMKNIQKAIGEDPTAADRNATWSQNLFRYVPVMSTLAGNKPAIDRMGHPINRSALERTPFSSVISEEKDPAGPVWQKLHDKGLILPEMSSAIKWNKSDFSGAKAQATFTAKRAEDRLTKANTDTFTPDEWYAMRQATGPYVERVANDLASSNIPTEKIQERLNQRVKDIDNAAKRHYILTGKFAG